MIGDISIDAHGTRASSGQMVMLSSIVRDTIDRMIREYKTDVMLNVIGLADEDAQDDLSDFIGHVMDMTALGGRQEEDFEKDVAIGNKMAKMLVWVDDDCGVKVSLRA